MYVCRYYHIDFLFFYFLEVLNGAPEDPDVSAQRHTATVEPKATAGSAPIWPRWRH